MVKKRDERKEGGSDGPDREHEEDLREELGLTTERANELVAMVNTMIRQSAPEGEYGRTSHILLSIAGRKDLSDVEKVACVFVFCCNTLGGRRQSMPEGMPQMRIEPEIVMPGVHMHEIKLNAKEFIDLEGGASGMLIAPEGLGPEDAIEPLMAVLMSMLRQMKKEDAKTFCRHASISFAKMALTGEIRRGKREVEK